MANTLTGEFLTSKGGRAFKTTEVRTELIDPFNGKPIYRKAVAFGLLANAGAQAVAHGISGLNLAEGAYLRMEGTVSTGSVVEPLGLAAGVTLFKIDATNITITSSTDLSSSTAIVLLEYTKT